MFDSYFTVTLKDGTYIDFNKKCNQINEFGSGRMICFKELKENNISYRILTLINVDEIKLIDSCLY